MRLLSSIFAAPLLAAGLLVPAAWAPLRAQAVNDISFDKLVHDFGTIKEEVKEATYTYNFKNVGSKKIKLTDVKASCGCTTPQWTQDEIAPGQVGYITATYSTTNRPGEFNKTITVKSRQVVESGTEPDERITVLTIKGVVTPRVKTIADYYPYRSGSLLWNTNHVAFSRLYPGTAQFTKWKLYNAGSKPVTLKGVNGAPAHVKVDVPVGKVIAPNDSLDIMVGFDGAKVNDWGWVYHNLSLFTDDSAETSKPFFVSAMIEENFAAWTDAQKANAPEALFERTTHEFGKITAGSTVKTAFKFTNNGKSDLIIRKTKASCGCTASDPDKTVLKPGESSHIAVAYDSTGKNGKEQKTVTVITNDPKRSTIYLTISGEIVPAGPAPAPTSGGSN